MVFLLYTFFNKTPFVGKPASRSSSFTIAERKKSFEALTNRQADVHGLKRGVKQIDPRLSSGHQLHSSQDSLANSRTGSVSLVHPSGLKSYSCVSSRRSSRDEGPMSSALSLSMMPTTNSSSTISSNTIPLKRSSPPTIISKPPLAAGFEEQSSSKSDHHNSLSESIKDMERANNAEIDSKKNEQISDKTKGHKSASRTVSRTSTKEKNSMKN